MSTTLTRPPKLASLPKAATGITGFDEITGGGLPEGRTSLVCGSAGCGKTLFAMQFLIHGALDSKEPGVFIAFEETAKDLAENVASLGFDLNRLMAKKKLAIDHIHIERSEIEESGEYDLDGLFVRLAYAIDSVGAKRIVLDTLEALFSSLPNEGIIRTELRRLFRWLKDRGMTALITAERGSGTLTRHGLEEYVSDCVILLDHRVTEQLSTRRLRVVKYRGSSHGTNEYPFLIDERGISVIPITSVGLEHHASSERISSGIPQLDEMLSGQGFYRGSSILISGTAGTGKSSLAAHFARTVCASGERCLYFAFEESTSQIIRNMKSIGIDLARYVQSGLLRFHAVRATSSGLELHIATMHKLVDEFKPSAAIVDPLTNLLRIGEESEVSAALMKLIDKLKVLQVTGFFTSLTRGGDALESTEVGVSSLMDTWLLLRDIESSGERNRGLYVLKSRGMAHSNQIREFHLSDQGVKLTPAYLGPEGVLTGAARQAQEERERAEALARRQQITRKQRELEHKRQAIEAQVAALRASFEAEAEELLRNIEEHESSNSTIDDNRRAMAILRQAETFIRNGAKQNGKNNNEKRAAKTRSEPLAKKRSR
jgi:circadian clock protein KaiC